MSYGRLFDDECPGCSHDVTVVSYLHDPPPIPIHVYADVYKRDDLDPGCRYLDCPVCRFDLQSVDYDEDRPKGERWIEREGRVRNEH